MNLFVSNYNFFPKNIHDYYFGLRNKFHVSFFKKSSIENEGIKKWQKNSLNLNFYIRGECKNW